MVLDTLGIPHLTYESLSVCVGKYGTHLCNPDATYSYKGEKTQLYRNGMRIALTLSTEGYPQIGLVDSELNHLVYAYQNSDGWHFKYLDQDASKDGMTSIILDSDGYPHISYTNAGDYLLKYAYKDTLGWHIRTVGSQMGDDMTLYLDQYGLPQIGFFDRQNMDLKYARRTKPFSEMTIWPQNLWGYGLPGDSLTYKLELTNTGQLTDAFEITYRDNGWPMFSPSLVGPLEPSETASFEIQVSIPPTVTLGSTDSATISIVSQNDSDEHRRVELNTYSGFTTFLPLVER